MLVAYAVIAKIIFIFILTVCIYSMDLPHIKDNDTVCYSLLSLWSAWLNLIQQVFHLKINNTRLLSLDGLNYWNVASHLVVNFWSAVHLILSGQRVSRMVIGNHFHCDWQADQGCKSSPITASSQWVFQGHIKLWKFSFSTRPQLYVNCHSLLNS